MSCRFCCQDSVVDILSELWGLDEGRCVVSARHIRESVSREFASESST